MTRTGKPGRIVSAGAMLSWQRMICWLASLMVSCPPLRIAWIKRSSSLVASLAPTLSNMDSPAAFASSHQ